MPPQRQAQWRGWAEPPQRQTSLMLAGGGVARAVRGADCRRGIPPQAGMFL
jgi:hypothetical protein